VVIMRTVRRFVEDLLRSRRPKGFEASPEDADLARTAIMLRAARSGSGTPGEEFVTRLRGQLATELGDATPHRPGHRRRTFIQATSLGAAAAAAGAGVERVVTGALAGSPSSAASGRLTPSRGSWQAIVASADLPDGTVRSFSVGGIEGFVERSGGRLRAVSGVCTHQGCRLTYAEASARFVCPCHGAQFALDGTVAWHRQNITLTALPRLAVRETDGFVQVYTARRP
jgi:cytochrome b6-f complex iron-sulfur subunit